MINNLPTNINGYIEGYYGQLLNWSERNTILKKLYNCGFNSYLYCPKEDLKHRQDWRREYTKRWTSSLKKFCMKARQNKLNIFIGMSPGLDFNFQNYDNDFKILLKKLKLFRSNGATHIVLMFDDISPKPNFKSTISKTEGTLHAELANSLSEALNEIIFVVPRVYSDELIEKKCTYLMDFGKTLKNDIPIFYCGKKIISETNKNSELKILKKFTSNRVIFWDNLFANDYCPKRIFLGPYFGRPFFKDTMINPTGLIQTDLFLLDLINLTLKTKNSHDGLSCTLQKYKVPKEFNIVCEYFFPINFNINDLNKTFTYNQKIEALDILIWKWKSSLSREWYKYMLILKQDLQLLYEKLENDRIKKIFPNPLSKTLLKLRRRNS